MYIYRLLHQNPQITAQEVEDNFDGNICRCTGYRPILDAMKSFAGLNSPGSKPIDIEASLTSFFSLLKTKALQLHKSKTFKC